MSARLYYRASGVGPPVILLHPIGLNGHFWDSVLSLLPSDFEAVALDLRGHGLSPAEGVVITLGVLAADVMEFLHSTGRCPAVLVGLSLGAMVAQLVALADPQAVQSLVLADTLHDVSTRFAMTLEARADATERGGMIATVDDTVRRWFSPSSVLAQPSLIESVRAVLLQADPTVHAQTWRAIQDLHLRDSVGGIHCPVLVVWGADDVATPPEECRELAHRLPLSRGKEIPRAGHMSAIEQPEVFAGLVADFVRAGWAQ